MFMFSLSPVSQLGGPYPRAIYRQLQALKPFLYLQTRELYISILPFGGSSVFIILTEAGIVVSPGVIFETDCDCRTLATKTPFSRSKCLCSRT